MKNKAILLIEFQKTWTEKGIFFKMIKKELMLRNVVENTKNVISVARSRGVKIIQAPLILDKIDKERYKKTPFPARFLKRFTKGNWKSEFTDGIYKSSDIVVKGRYGFDALEGSNLEKLLKENIIKTVFVCGFTTDHCVKETMNSLINKEFNCILVSDCTATRSNKLQMKIENKFEIISSKQLITDILNSDG
ncbi:N-carbamoylsarcosine amidase [bacterium BMS3Abin04]|nr:N-carbamoylsarcosine amidase [bacterium BMS3Abin04]